MKIVMISGSRNPEGQTARAAEAVLQAAGTADIARHVLPSLKIERCRQCNDDGWGICRSDGRCIIEDDLTAILKSITSADAVLFATPVYFSDLSESMRAFLDRLRRMCINPAGRAVVKGKVVAGVCVAGGGGGGAPACCVSLEKVLATCGFDVVDLVPVRRQNLEAKLPRLRSLGEWLATKPASG